MPIDYASLRIIWWVLLGVLLIGFAIMDGFDFGTGMLLPFIGKDDVERRIVINSIAATWEGNQVWFILGGGATFAAWPMVYAVSFSGFYLAMFVVLLGLILRPVGFKYRSKMPSPQWRSAWDIAIFIGSFVPSLIFGVAVGNVLQGVPFHFDLSLRAFYTGSFWGLLNPFALFCGVLSVVMLLMQGANFLVNKVTSPIRERVVIVSRVSSLLTVLLFIAGGYWIAKGIQGFQLSSETVANGPSNPLYKTVVMQTGAWLHNYVQYPWMKTAPMVGIAGALCSLLLTKRFAKCGLVFSSLSIFGIISTVGLSMFPFILPSSSNVTSSLTVFDASSSQLTLFVMLVVTLIFMPIILMYTAWVYRVLRGKITRDTILNNDQTAY